MEIDIKEELDFLSWVKKVNEKATLIQLRIRDKIDISEDDYFLLQVLHRVWYEGELPFYQSRFDIEPDNVTEQGLFGDLAVTYPPIMSDGMVVEPAISEPIKLKKDENKEIRDLG